MKKKLIIAIEVTLVIIGVCYLATRDSLVYFNNLVSILVAELFLLLYLTIKEK